MINTGNFPRRVLEHSENLEAHFLMSMSWFVGSKNANVCTPRPLDSEHSSPSSPVMINILKLNQDAK